MSFIHLLVALLSGLWISAEAPLHGVRPSIHSAAVGVNSTDASGGGSNTAHPRRSCSADCRAVGSYGGRIVLPPEDRPVEKRVSGAPFVDRFRRVPMQPSDGAAFAFRRVDLGRAAIRVNYCNWRC